MMGMERKEEEEDDEEENEGGGRVNVDKGEIKLK